MFTDFFNRLFSNNKNKKQAHFSQYEDADYKDINHDNKQYKKTYIKAFSIVPVIFTLMILIFLSSQAFYTVKDSEYAVITTFGKPSVVTNSGMHIKIPFIQNIHYVTKNIIGEAIGYDEKTNESLNKESLMITLDYNFINADFYIEYHIIDPTKALYKSDKPNIILENLAQSYIRDTVGLYKVDDVLTTEKNAIQNIIKDKLTKRLEKEDLGLQVINVTIQDAEPPTEEIKTAFKSVETAKQGKETAINNANKYKNIHIPEANAQADKIIKEAEAKKEQRINEAKGQVARFNSLYTEYIKYPDITKKRMFYETMEDILPSLQIIIKDDASSNTIIPINSLTNFTPTVTNDDNSSNNNIDNQKINN